MKLKEIQSIIKDFEESKLMSLELEMDSFKLKLSKNKTEQTINTQPEEKPEVTIDEEKPILEPNINMPEDVIKSPLVGTFYASANPEASPYVKTGDVVKKGDIVCIIEAMKIMNEITSPFDGIIEKVHINSGSVIGFDDILFTVGRHATTK